MAYTALISRRIKKKTSLEEKSSGEHLEGETLMKTEQVWILLRNERVSIFKNRYNLACTWNTYDVHMFIVTAESTSYPKRIGDYVSYFRLILKTKAAQTTESCTKRRMVDWNFENGIEIAWLLFFHRCEFRC